MIDYIEGIININKRMKELNEALLKKDSKQAKLLCDEISADIKLVRHQITIQFDE